MRFFKDRISLYTVIYRGTSFLNKTEFVLKLRKINVHTSLLYKEYECIIEQQISTETFLANCMKILQTI